MPSANATLPPQENILLNLGCNVAAPAFMLTKGAKLLNLSPKTALVVALAFPFAYGIYDLARRRNFNVLSALGFSSTLATGGLSLLKLEPFWFAVKEAIVPTLIGLAVLLSRHSKSSLLNAMMLNEQVVNRTRILDALRSASREHDFERLLDRTNWMLAGSFALSAVLNFILARSIITALPDTIEFNEQLGRLTWISYIVIMVPSLGMMIFALMRMFKGLTALTGLSLDDMLHAPPEKGKDAEPPTPGGTP
ncbi:MAG TPA: VC0807 family protein [Lacunisphaera sp.]|nr:VC0807 family protein [Lacunisphaera sp.]